MPCSWCVSQGLVCKMIARTKRYEAYIRRGCSCDSSSIPLSSYKFSRSSVVSRMLNVIPNLS
ncbi:hypothetical protein MYCTH_60350 [Thermothelomyces thermophilus ATCC 42464]|uniref:Uncharacterized protein n=1 Tax=Thermothelomyces thermophilus (strain ATCC 42464 / BCRC 31852 / DSM 1799) TaxID=573729 RepID=G2QLY7_THET4|nr:uncharacterized protein MYCTH_60350 [Thermothelomyces thermophilus ATCC 42464]AEO60967.1 hypothetical protein MYCTH_60350 [Thermothelomyces thermophilus ATCC 42464]